VNLSDNQYLSRDVDGVYILTENSDAHRLLFVRFSHDVDATHAVVSGLPGAVSKGTYSGNDAMFYLQYEPVEAGNQYELIITGLKKADPASEDMGAIRIRLKR